MSFTHAHYDAQDQNKVKRLCGAGEPVTAGLTSGELTSPVTTWPAAPVPAAMLRFDAGLLQWIDPRTEAQAWADVRARRDALLAATDWTVTRALETSASIPAAWSNYRQALRDITTQEDPFDITWPTPPNE